MAARQEMGPDDDTSRLEAVPTAVAGYLQHLHERFRGLDDGAVATYIPELSHADPAHFGICLATVDGALYETGDTRVPFTIQSISKPLTYGLALELLGREAVRARIGVEPSGNAFNEISISPTTGMPSNPLINAGAIACAGLVAAQAEEDPYALLRDAYGRYVGHPVDLDDAVFRSESETGHRNRGMAHVMRGLAAIDDPEAALDLYFRQCSMRVDCRDLAVVAATLANGGLNPRTGERAVGEGVVRDVLSVMTSCGMYDFAGEWLVSVGLPAKSGVSGGIVAVLPGRFGIGVYSPRVDAQGNSNRGIAVCRELSADLSVHLVRSGERPAPPLRAVFGLADRTSKRVRPQAQRTAIQAAGSRVLVVELQGELGFDAAEALARRAEEAADPHAVVVVDLRRVERADDGGIRLLARLAERIEAQGGRLALTACGSLGEPALAGLPATVAVLADLDLALEWAEDELLALLGAEPALEHVPLAAHELLAGLSPGALARLEPALGTARAEAGALLVRQGDAAAEVFLVTDGTLSVVYTTPDGSTHRLTTISAGGTFGELAYVDRRARSADVRTDSAVTCRTLPYATIDALATSDPALHATLLRNLLRVVVATLRQVNDEVTHLTR